MAGNPRARFLLDRSYHRKIGERVPCRFLYRGRFLSRRSVFLDEFASQSSRFLGARPGQQIGLTSLQAMWLLDVREPPDESHRKGKRGYQVKTISAKPSLRQKP